MKKIDKVLFIGSKQLGLNCLKKMFSLSPKTLTAVLTFDDRADGRTKFEDFREFSSQNNLPFHVAQNAADSERIIDSISPDICFVVGWYWLISKNILEKVPHGLLGVHNSLLPKYRGSSPLIWSIINGEPNVGFSLFTFTEAMDEGDIWLQFKMPLEHHHDVSSVLMELEKHLETELEKNYQNILDGNIKPVSQDHSGATYCANRIPEDGLIDWNKPAREIFNFIRAQTRPYPGAYTLYKGKKLILWNAELNERVYYGTAGQIAEISGNSIVIIAGDHRAILVTAVNYEGRDQKAVEVIKTIKTRLGKEYSF